MKYVITADGEEIEIVEAENVCQALTEYGRKIGCYEDSLDIFWRAGQYISDNELLVDLFYGITETIITNIFVIQEAIYNKENKGE